MKYEEVLPVVVSIIIIVLVAFLRRDERLAPILATMPINIPIMLWIITSTSGMTQDKMTATAQSMFWNMFPTVLFIGVVWVAFRWGWQLLPALGAGYAAWGALLALINRVRNG
jgi:hypothetical protein